MSKTDLYTATFGEAEDASKVAKALHTSLAGNPDYISSSIMVSFVPTHSSVEVYIWPQELKCMIPEFLTDYMAFVKFCNKALQEDV